MILSTLVRRGIVLASLLATLTGFAQTINFNYDGNVVNAVGKGFNGSQSSYQVNAYINGSFTTDLNTNDNGSFSWSQGAP